MSLWDTGLCLCSPSPECLVGRETPVPEWSRDLFTVVITFTLCVPLAALIPRICLWRLEVEALAWKIVLKGRKGRQRC